MQLAGQGEPARAIAECDLPLVRITSNVTTRKAAGPVRGITTPFDSTSPFRWASTKLRQPRFVTCISSVPVWLHQEEGLWFHSAHRHLALK